MSDEQIINICISACPCNHKINIRLRGEKYRLLRLCELMDYCDKQEERRIVNEGKKEIQISKL
jgi:hypothetical protein